MCIQFEFGGITCCKTVPQDPNCCNTKLAADGGKPQTVTQLAIGDTSSPSHTCVELGVAGNTEELLSGVAQLEVFSTDLLGVLFKLFISPVVGGPPGLSPGVRVDLFRVSFNSCGPLRG